MAKGGTREGAGRPKGAINKATAEIREAAQEYTAEALEALASIMRTSESDAAKVSAIKELLDRAYGKPSQAIDANLNASETLTELVRRIVLPKH